MYLLTTPWWLRLLFPGCTWQMPGKERTVYLTFDDGPHPAATPFVLAQLQQYGAKGTFFCIGKNVADQPALYQQVLAAGHTTGNHTMHHLNGWKTEDKIYLDDIKEADLWIDSPLMRPPYGRIKWSQIRKVGSRQSAVGRKGSAKNSISPIIMCSVLSADFDTTIDGEKCYQNVVRNIRPGSIIVFHDSAKALPRLQYALPKVLRWLKENGYAMKAIPM